MNNNNKITLKEFFESEEHLFIHCNTKAKAAKLCKEFNKLGYKWLSGKSYSYTYNWNKYKQDTCYDNRHMYVSIGYLSYNNFKIYEFEDIIFNNKDNDCMFLPNDNND